MHRDILKIQDGVAIVENSIKKKFSSHLPIIF